MTLISKNVYIDQLDNIVNKYNNAYHSTIKMNPVNVKSSIYTNLNKENKKEGSKFKVGDINRISKYKNTFANCYVPNWSVEGFLIKKVKNTVPWTCHVSSCLNKEEIVGTLYEKELQKTHQKEFRVEKVVKTKGDKIYAKWKGCDNSFNSWIDKKT